MRLRTSRSFPVFILTIMVLAAMVLTISAGAQDVASQAKKSSKNKIAPYALIFGTVWSANGQPVYGVPIKIRRSDQKKAKWETMSDHRGEFAQRVPAGKADYDVWADLKPPKGKKGWQRPETTAHIENDERIDIGLHLTE